MLRLFTLWLWMCSLLTSTVGVSIAHIYCYCKGEGNVALSLPWTPASEEDESCAALGHEAEGCCRVSTEPECAMSAVSCCEAAEVRTCCSQSVEAGWAPEQLPCTSKTVKIYQLKLDLYAPLSWDQLPDLPLWADEVPHFWKCVCPTLCWRKPSNKAPPTALPPPLSGREICIRYEVFRC